ncbi:MAG TPA: prephenate dehydratase domain-containing protein [Methanospirillum sp.]|uniref:prephenate dehydratase n=1 Tax=Methanospirillum sp. TaxID=45200 RepID=UPI002D0E3B6D|nr:prephenate dehydratase domain-containing protein [Methanospirillum sp.]HOJ95771.1 prephenate dehydratase domain-containing protein [Methanospirillum sp.]HOL42061.1 prephenate dehydratase domain-containing protein [Methanospirillum sp.]HPP77831.1 prephenate dehydratase domain-containing protein [Methanospirillum sp.]
MTIITLGPEGTFSHDLAQMMDSDIILVPTISRVFARVLDTGIPGLVPLENSEAGGVTATMDGLMQHPVFISEERYLPVHHTLASDTPLDKITVIFAHPQSHEQCSRYIDDLGVPVIHTESNAASAHAQKERSGSAAILSRTLAERSGIPVLAENIENNPDNVTRFIVIRKDPGIEEHPEKCSIIVDPGENRAGLLYDLLSPFKETGVNLTRIESRPSKRCMGNYVFFIDLQCEGNWKEAIERIRTISRVKHLGCYHLTGDNPCR